MVPARRLNEKNVARDTGIEYHPGGGSVLSRDRPDGAVVKRKWRRPTEDGSSEAVDRKSRRAGPRACRHWRVNRLPTQTALSSTILVCQTSFVRLEAADTSL